LIAQREALLLFHDEDFSLNQIAEALNLDLPAVKSRLRHARGVRRQPAGEELDAEGKGG
jgi:DNA-directed RNA polymerase specialized sigma24 family protein